MKKYLICLAIIPFFLTGCVSGNQSDQIFNFQECIDAGNPVMESYPRQCRTADGRVFAENIGHELENN